MTAGTLGRGAYKGTHRLHHKVITVQIIEIGPGCLICAVIEQAGAKETKGGSKLCILRKKAIRSELLANKPSPRLVLIKRVDDIVSVAPGVIPRKIMSATMRLGEVNGIEPVPCPALSKAG